MYAVAREDNGYHNWTPDLGEFDVPGSTFSLGLHGPISEFSLGLHSKADITELYDKRPGRFSKYEFDPKLPVLYDHLNILPEALRCAWLALLQNDMKRNDTTCNDFHSYLNSFIKADLAKDGNIHNELVDEMIRPLFANVNLMPIPPLGLFKDEDLYKTLPVSITKSWTRTFCIRNDHHLEVPLFQSSMYLAWMEYMLPVVQADLGAKTQAQLKQMYVTCTDQVIS